MITFFDHQNKSIKEVEDSWLRGNKNVLLVLPTGSGKTLVKAEVARKELYNEFANISRMNNGITIVFAHRDVLLGQISDAMCMLHVKHTFIAAKHTIKDITNVNLKERGDSFYEPTSKVIIASVDSFMAQMKKGQLERLIPFVTQWLMDEAHHLQLGNKWGKCIIKLPNARGLGVTATPLRADGRGLGRGEIVKYDGDENPVLDNDGVFDDMVVGATMGELLDIGRLAAYKIYVPPSRLNIKGMNTTPSGDLNQKELAVRTDNSDITGDAVTHYLRIANGMQAITYCVNIAHSEHVADQFNKAGVVSKALSSKTPIRERQKAVQDFKNGIIKNLVNSDLFGEGFDVPALVVGIMLRKTESYSLFKQQFGRPLRVLEGKDFGIIIDHVGNVQDMMLKYGLKQPHDDPEWTLERAKKRKSSDSDEPVGRVCPECAAFYIPSTSKFECPYCKHEETPAEVADAHKEFLHKNGDLVELNVNFVTELLAKRKKIWEDKDKVHDRMRFSPNMVKTSVMNNHTKRQYAHTLLSSKIQQWCSDMSRINKWGVEVTQLEFEAEFRVNILKAQTLPERDALELLEKINHDYL